MCKLAAAIAALVFGFADKVEVAEAVSQLNADTAESATGAMLCLCSADAHNKLVCCIRQLDYLWQQLEKLVFTRSRLKVLVVEHGGLGPAEPLQQRGERGEVYMLDGV